MGRRVRPGVGARRQQKRVGDKIKLTIKHPSFCNLNFTGEPLDEVLVNDAIRGCEKSENVRNKVALVCVKPVLPVVEILGEIHLFGGPE